MGPACCPLGCGTNIVVGAVGAAAVAAAAVAVAAAAITVAVVAS
jgi:hypothetical protein